MVRISVGFRPDPLATGRYGVHNRHREELIAVTDNPMRPRDDEEDPEETSTKPDYINDAHPGEDREDAVVDEQGEESFPASDPPANY